MEKKISDLKVGDKFFYGTWYNLLSLDVIKGVPIANVTKEYDKRVFNLIIGKDEMVRIPYKNNMPASYDSETELKDTLACLLRIYQDNTYGDNVWRKLIEEKAEKITQ